MSIAVYSIIVLLFSAIMHEIAHGSVANMMGDSTAKNAGRLTINPIKHLDPFGSILLPALLFIFTLGNGPIIGWAKPVPINPLNFKNYKKGMLSVAFAGPLSNLVIAIIFGLIIRFFFLPNELFALFSIIVIYNFILAIFNLVPIPPLDGSHLLLSLLPDQFFGFKKVYQEYGLFILLFFIAFGLNYVFAISRLLFKLISGISF